MRPYGTPRRRAQDRPVLVAGAFGQGNPGDESVLRAWVEGLAPLRTVATSAAPAEDTGCPVVDSRRPGAVARAALSSRAVVVTATVFKTLPPGSGRRPHSLLVNTLLLTAAVRLAGRPVLMAGVGVGALASRRARLLARVTARTATSVTVRDDESRQLLRSIGVRRPVEVAADVVWSLGPAGSPGARRPTTERGKGRAADDERGPTVVMALSHLAGGPDLGPRLARTAELLHDGGARVALQPWQAGADEALAADIVQGCRAPLTLSPRPADVSDAAAALRGADVVIALRFHSLVAAALAGVPAVAVTHEPKLAGLARRMRQTSIQSEFRSEELAAATMRAWRIQSPDPELVTREHQVATAMTAAVRDRITGPPRRRGTIVHGAATQRAHGTRSVNRVVM